jgi:hypothetical protein
MNIDPKIYDYPPSLEEKLDLIRNNHPRLSVKDQNMLDLAGVGMEFLSNADKVTLERLWVITRYNQARRGAF